MSEAEDRIMKAKLKIVYGNHFFAYLSLYLQIEEDKTGRIPDGCGMAVNPKGRLWYKKEFVEKISDEELIGVLKHEILHLGLLHLVRQGRRDSFMWNIATDLVINTILLKGKDKLPQGIKPTPQNTFEIIGKVIYEVDGKSAEEIYEELPEIPQSKQKLYINFDVHDNNGEKIEGKELTEAELQEIETEWFNKVQTAMILAQQRGDLPRGLERYVDGLKESEINWRVILRQFIQQFIPNDYTWMSRSKKGYALGIYLPDTTKEKIDIVISVDTSGSIEQPQLTKFLSEIIGIAKTFREILTMRILFHDEKVQADYTIKNGSIPEILKMQIKGGGGTSHKKVFKKIKEEIKDCKCLIAFTDGYSDIEEINMNNYNFAKLFIINKEGIIPKQKGIKCIKLRGEL